MKRVNSGGIGLQEQVFIAEETIAARCSVVITSNDQDSSMPHCKMGTTALDYAGGGVTIAGALSGQICRVVRGGGIVSGVYLGSDVGAGDGLACCNNTSGGAASGAGRLIGVRTYTPAGTVGGSGSSLTGTATTTARIIAKALVSGGFGSAIPVLVIGAA